ncbi:MAG: sigma-70 family RNA polymerase sigma factor [Patescibacteria group bacterium]
MNRSDEQLVVEYRAGDAAAFELLVRRHMRAVYGIAYRYAGDAEIAADIAQDSFVKAWRHLKQFDEKKSFRAWLFAIVRYTALDALKKKKEVPFSAFDTIDGGNVLTDTMVSGAPDAHERAVLEEERRALAAAIEKMPFLSRMVVTYHADGHTFREIAEVLGKSVNTVKSWHRRALVVLRNLLAQQ